MLNFLKEYFIFSRGERNGITVLLIIIILLIFLPYAISLLREREEIDFSQFQKEIKEFEERQALAQELRHQQKPDSFELFNFDPNEIEEDDWKKLGVSERTARTIINYREKGGVFLEKDDLLKIYGFDSSTYKILEPYIVVEDDERNSEKYAMNPFDKPVYRKQYEREQPRERNFQYGKNTEYRHKENFTVELNAADSLALVRVNGIGPALSARIIKYRSLLGGFVRVDQVLEVYGMDSALFQIMKPSLTVDETRVNKIPINGIALEDLEKHPYFRRNLARAILNYRQHHGAFTAIEDLKKIYVMDEVLFQKIKPYIALDDIDG